MNKLRISLLSSLGLLLLIVGGSLLLQPESASGSSRRRASFSADTPVAVSQEPGAPGLEAPALPARSDAGPAPERNDLHGEEGERVEEDDLEEPPEPEEPWGPEGSTTE